MKNSSKGAVPMKYSVKFIDNFNILKDLNNIRTRISNEFEPTQELDKYLLLEGMLDERINKAIEAMNEEVREEE
ncbi:MAG: hypothetical protein IJ966_02700 [Bacilli bacterium]|nr:hypothetical protein [Bacilli bacterium]